jgi:FmdE, Molybdenum formylmethanofuran dehydrogenase operon
MSHMKMLLRGGLLCVTTLLLPSPAFAETPEEWVSLGARVHGGFGTYIALGIRVGLDAVEKLGAKPRELDVTVYDGVATPCPCIADGIMIATTASPGQSTLRVAAEKAPAEHMAVVVIRSRKDGRALRYTVPDGLRAKLADWNKGNDPMGRWKVVMAAPEAQLYAREVLSPTFVPK